MKEKLRIRHDWLVRRVRHLVRNGKTPFYIEKQEIIKWGIMEYADATIAELASVIGSKFTFVRKNNAGSPLYWVVNEVERARILNTINKYLDDVDVDNYEAIIQNGYKVIFSEKPPVGLFALPLSSQAKQQEMSHTENTQHSVTSILSSNTNMASVDKSADPMQMQIVSVRANELKSLDEQIDEYTTKLESLKTRRDSIAKTLDIVYDSLNKLASV